MLPRPHKRTRTRRPAIKRALLVLAAVTTAFTTVLATNASAAGSVNYVALGDSYSSGVGSGSYISSSGNCLRSTLAYSQLWANAPRPGQLHLGGLLRRHHHRRAEQPALGAEHRDQPGDDHHRRQRRRLLLVMQTCVLSSDSACLSAINTATAQAKSVLPGKLATTFSAIRAAAPGARVVVMGYPEFYDLGNSWYCPGLSTTDRTALNNAADTLDGVIQTAAQNAGDSYADVQEQVLRPRAVRLLQRVAALGERQRRHRVLPPDGRRPVRRLPAGDGLDHRLRWRIARH